MRKRGGGWIASSIASAAPTIPPTTNHGHAGYGVPAGANRWRSSQCQRQRKVRARRRALHRRLAATRTRAHGEPAHPVLALGSNFQRQQLSYSG